MSSGRASVTNMSDRERRGIQTKALIAIVIAACFIIPFMITMDSHFVVKLSKDFISSTDSDYNCFSVVLREDDATDNIYKELKIEYNKTDNEIAKTFTQPKEDKIIGFKSVHVNNTNSTYLTNIDYDVEFNESTNIYESYNFENFTAYNEITKTLTTQESINEDNENTNLDVFLETDTPTFETYENYQYGIWWGGSLLDYNYLLTQTINVPNDIEYESLYCKVRYDTRVSPTFPIVFRARVVELPSSSVLSDKTFYITDPEVLVGLNLDLLNNNIILDNAKTYELRINGNPSSYYDNNLLFGIHEVDSVNEQLDLGTLYWYMNSFIPISFTETTKEMWLYGVEENDNTGVVEHSYIYGSYKIVKLQATLNLMDINDIPNNLYNFTIYTNISANYTNYIGYNVSTTFDVNLVDLTQINNLHNGTNIYNVSYNDTRNYIDNYNIMRFMIVFVSDNSFDFMFHNLTLNLTYIDTTYNAFDVTVNSNIEGNITLSQRTTIYFKDTDFGSAKHTIYSDFININMTLIIQTPLKLVIYNFTYTYEMSQSEIIYLIDELNGNPFELQISYFGSTIMVYTFDDERKIRKHSNDYDIYI